jgi:uracil-DNA glycosylase family 4
MTNLSYISDLEDLHEAMRSDLNFADLRKGKNPLIPGEGRSPTRVMIVGEAPGADEVMQGRPFVGTSGQVLRQLMRIAELTTGDNQMRPNCWLTNAVKYRPPRNRTPLWYEINKFRPYLLREWHIVGRPELMITVGAVALSAFAGRQLSIGPHVGKPITLANGVVVWPMFHPAFGLRGSDHVKDIIESHWQALAEWMNDHYTR